MECNASEYYHDFIEHEENFEKDAKAYMASEFSKNILECIDYASVIEKRKANFKVVNDALGKTNLFSTKVNGVPFAYPFTVKDGNVLRAKLIENKIYVAKYWNSEHSALFNDIERRLADNTLPLPIDQRYDKEDMLFMINTIKSII